MKQLLDTVWQRRGVSWVWDDAAFASVTKASEVFSLRRLMLSTTGWPDDLQSNDGDTLVVAGLDASLDLLEPKDAETWLDQEVKRVILGFQDNYSGDAALIFWLPGGRQRIDVATASDAVHWRCAAPFTGTTIEFGRILWGEAREYPQEIVMKEQSQPVGLFHARIT